MPTTNHSYSGFLGSGARESMRVEGRWHLFDDDVLRPVVDGKVRTQAGLWVNVAFLIDSGADRTVFDVRYRSLLAPLALPDRQPSRLAGIGGQASASMIQ